MGVVTPLLTACGGFLLAVLWMDLIFDAQVLGHRRSGGELPEPVLASIAGYYQRDDHIAADAPPDCSCHGGPVGRVGIPSSPPGTIPAGW